MAKIVRRRMELLAAHDEQILKTQGTPEWDKLVGGFHLDAAYALKGLTESPHGAFGFLDMLAAPITGIWTAIETMFGDLWEASLNCHPRILAALKGKPNRIKNADTKTTIPDQRSSARDLDPSLSLSLIELQAFDLRGSMGSVFRIQRRFEFTRLSSIREAYSRAFSDKSSRIDAALSRKSFDALSAVRNVIVHKSGYADSVYVQQCTFLDIPKTAIGQPLHLDGKIVADLVGAAIADTKSFMIAVDDWIEQN